MAISHKINAYSDDKLLTKDNHNDQSFHRPKNSHLTT